MISLLCRQECTRMKVVCRGQSFTRDTRELIIHHWHPHLWISNLKLNYVTYSCNWCAAKFFLLVRYLEALSHSLFICNIRKCVGSFCFAMLCGYSPVHSFACLNHWTEICSISSWCHNHVIFSHCLLTAGQRPFLTVHLDATLFCSKLVHTVAGVCAGVVSSTALGTGSKV